MIEFINDNKSYDTISIIIPDTNARDYPQDIRIIAGGDNILTSNEMFVFEYPDILECGIRFHSNYIIECFIMNNKLYVEIYYCGSFYTGFSCEYDNSLRKYIEEINLRMD